MEFNKEIFSRQIPIVGLFVQQLAYYRGLYSALDAIPAYRDFWSCTLNNHLKQATVDWCKVFGSPKEDIQWAKTPTGDTEIKARQDFLRRIVLITGLSQEGREDYQKKLLALRDKYVAHLDLKKPLEAPMPVFDIALQVADVYREWVRQVIKPVLMSSRPFSADYDMWKTEASTIVSRYPHP
jgi:hypothetical protein